VIRGSEDCAVDVRADDAAELRHGVCEADPDACCDGAVEGADAFWPDDRVGGAGAGDGYDEGEVFHDGVRDGDKDYVTDYCGAFDGYCCGPGPDPFLV